MRNNYEVDTLISMNSRRESERRMCARLPNCAYSEAYAIVNVSSTASQWSFAS